MKIPRWLGLTASFATFAFWLLGVGVPLAALVLRTSRGGTFTSLGDPDIMSVAWVTACQAFASTVFSVLIGLPLGLAAAGASPRLANSVDTLLLLPQGVPTVVAATAWVAWLGRSGYCLAAVILAHVFFNAPWVALLVAQARRAVPQSQVDAAATLGAGNWARFRFVTWPQLRWASGAAAVQVLAVCSMSFALVMILGGGPPVETLETALYARLRGGSLELGGAAACAAWEILLTLAPWTLLLVVRARSQPAVAQVMMPQAQNRSSGFAGGIALACAVIFFIPYLAVFFGGGVSSWASADFWGEAWAPLRLSVFIAFAASCGALLVAAFATLASSFAPDGMRAFVGALLALPSGLSVLVLGLGGWLAYSRWIDPFEGSLAAIIGLQITVFFPVSFRLLWPVAQGGQRSAMEAAWTLGASPWQAFWQVDWPRWRAPVFSALALVGALALGEVAAVSLFYSEKLIPLPLLVSRWMGQYRFEEARAVSALLLAGAAALMVGVSKVGRAYAGSRI